MIGDRPRVGVVTDSNADVPLDLRQKYGIVVAPLTVHFGQEQYRDGVDITTREFFARLRAGDTHSVPTTSQISTGGWTAAYLQAIDQIQAAGAALDGLVVVTIAGSLSGTYSAACTAAEGLDIPIEVVDSRQISLGTGWLVIAAARAAHEGQSLPDIAAQARNMVPRLRLWGMLDSLEHVQRSGRIGKGAALVGTLLNVKPMLQIREGEVLPIGRVRTRRRALRRLVELLEEEAPIEQLAVLHSDFPEAAGELASMVTHLHPLERLLIVEIGPALGTHLGPGAVGLTCVKRPHA
jgi:DegV family protein with EDD domain